MMPNRNDATHEMAQLRAAIAAAAARMIAQDGAEYGSAKRKAARQVLGEAQAGAHRDLLPDDAQVEEEVRHYHALFNAGTQPARLQRLRAIALEVMELLADYHPFLTGAVLNGTAGEHDDIRLQVFAESAKEVQIFLLNQNLHIEISESDHFRGPRHEPVEMASFLWRHEGVHVELYEQDDLRGARKQKSAERPLRIDIARLRELLDQDHQAHTTGNA
jgi:hypothetical protein